MTRDKTFPQPLVRFSNLKHMARSPAHYRASVLAGEDETNAARRFGTLCHTLILGGDRFAVFDGARRAGKAWEAFEAAHDGQLIVTASELDRGLEVARRVRENEFAGPLLIGRREHDLAWMNGQRPCGGRLDVMGDGFVCDVKTSASAEPAWFTRNGLRLAYHAQMAWYRDGMRRNGLRCEYAYLIAVETKEPYAVTPFLLTDEALEAGDKLCRLWLEQLLTCEASGTWPAYTQSMAEFDVPDDLELTYGEEPTEDANG